LKSIGIDAPVSGATLTPELIEYSKALDVMSGRASALGDATQAAKLSELSGKLRSGRLTVAFCGHFSAGKSTLVNSLCGANLLPASPIPTSANVVTVVNGEPSAETVFRDAQGNVHPANRIPVEKLHDYAVDGEGVSSIRVSYPIPLLGDRMAIVDTPGVDSTDGAHRAATESALHMADVVFYVTDYNHVQSEVNFKFLRSLARWGKPTYLLVNQIDKHREEQIRFSAFRDSLASALADWEIEPAATLFLSLRYPDHPLSQWKQLLELVGDLQPLADGLMTRSAARSAAHLAEQLRETLHAGNQDRREALLERLGEDAEPEARASRRAALEARLAGLQGAGDTRRDRIRAEADKLLGNANLTPAETREKAQQVLAALQPGFKVGWLSSAAKTEAERATRLDALTDDFNRQISAHATGFLKGMLRKEAAASGVQGEEMERSLDESFKPIDAEWLRSHVKPGAGADGQATLQYASDIAAALKSQYRKAATNWVDVLHENDRPALEAEIEDVRVRLGELAELEEKARELDALEAAEREEERRLLELLPKRDEDGEKLRLPAPEPIQAAELSVATTAPGEALAADVPREPAEAEEEVGETGKATRLGAPAGAAEKLERAAALLSNVSALRDVADGLYAKAERFRNRSFTIALFGAFSAGKSSFANALVGKPALPVSPNPTTATINRIVAPSDGHPDGTALVTMKTPEEFADDLRYSLKRVGIAKEKLEAAGADVAKLLALKEPVSAGELHPRGRPHLAFLNAAARGWNEFGPLLGTKLSADEAEYRRFASEEQASCFVAEIDLHVDSPITRSGAVLVDTPGADSINARHTGVAFQYIKNADAVLFVTYYNHAFTEADREFLNQLGSVKDVFELDKMFFVINAADLASSETELEAVREHVGTQLLKHGIRKPRLFAVSSMNGLQAKLDRNRGALEGSGLAGFENAFRRFSEEELGGLALAAANKELDRVSKLLDGWLDTANADASTREAKAARLNEQAARWGGDTAGFVPVATVQPLLQEVGEQLYHLRQRIKFRFKEHFQSAFHPSVLQDDGRDLKKLLVACGEDLKRSLQQDLLQELRAAGLRLEGAIQAMSEKTLASLEGLAEMEREGFQPEAGERLALELPLPDAFAGGPSFESKMLWGAFRSPKHFFEKEGAAQLRAELEEALLKAIDAALALSREQWEKAAENALRQSVSDAAQAWSKQLAAFALSMSRALREPGEERFIAELREQWEKIGR